MVNDSEKQIGEKLSHDFYIKLIQILQILCDEREREREREREGEQKTTKTIVSLSSLLFDVML